MPTFTIEDPRGRVLNIEGDEPPSEQELDAIFADAFPGSQLTEPIRAVQRGTLRAGQALDTLSAAAWAEVIPTLQKQAGQRQVLDQETSLSPVFKPARTDIGPPGNLLELTAQEDAQRRIGQVTAGVQEAAGDIAGAEQRIAAIPTTEAMQRFDEPGQWAKVWLMNPIEVTASLMAENLPQMVPGIYAGGSLAFAAGPLSMGAAALGQAAGVGAGSFSVEYANKILGVARDMGVDLTNPADTAAFFMDPARLGEAKAKGVARGIPVAAFDALTSGIAIRMAGTGVNAAEKILSKPFLKEVGKGVAVQAAGGGAGEAVGQVAAGEPFSAKDIAIEIVLEAAGAPFELTGAFTRPTMQTGPASTIEPPGDVFGGDAGFIGPPVPPPPPPPVSQGTTFPISGTPQPPTGIQTAQDVEVGRPARPFRQAPVIIGQTPTEKAIVTGAEPAVIHRLIAEAETVSNDSRLPVSARVEAMLLRDRLTHVLALQSERPGQPRVNPPGVWFGPSPLEPVDPDAGVVQGPPVPQFEPEPEQPDLPPAWPDAPTDALVPGLKGEAIDAAFKANADAFDKWKAGVQAWESAQPQNRPIILDTGNMIEAITPNIGGGWRSTSFSKKDKMLWGHEVFKTRLDAVLAYARGATPLAKMPFVPEVLPPREGTQNAIQERTPTPVPVGETPAAGPQVGPQVRQQEQTPEAPAQGQVTAVQPARAGEPIPFLPTKPESPTKQGKPFDAKKAKVQKKFLLEHIADAIKEAPEHVEWMDPALKAEHESLEFKGPGNYDSWVAQKAIEAEPLFQKYGIPETIPGRPGYTDVNGKEVPATPETPYKPQNRIDLLTNAIEKADDALRPRVTIAVPEDGLFTIINSKKALKAFQDMAQKFPTSAPKEPGGSTPKTEAKGITSLGNPDDSGTVKAVSLFLTEPSAKRPVLEYYWSDGKVTVATEGRKLIKVNHGIGGTSKKPLIQKPDGTKLPEGDVYPNWKQVVPTQQDTWFKDVDTGRLLSVLTQAKTAGVDPAKSRGEKGSMSVVLYENPDKSYGIGSVSDEVSSYHHNQQEGAVPKMILSLDHLIPSIQAHRYVGDSKITIKGTDDLGPVGLYGKNATTIIMPMRGNASKTYPQPPREQKESNEKEVQGQETLADKIRRAKIDTEGKVFDVIQGLPIAVWNAAVDVAAAAVSAGAAIVDAAKTALDWIRKNHPDLTFDTQEFLAKLQERWNPPVERVPGERTLPKRLDAGILTSDALKKAVTDRMYEVAPLASSEAVADKILEDIGDPVKAISVFRDNSIPWVDGIREALGVVIMEDLVHRELVAESANNPAEAARWRDEAAAFMNGTAGEMGFAEHGTNLGQSVNALKLWSRMTPAGMVLSAQRMIEGGNQLVLEKYGPLIRAAHKAAVGSRRTAVKDSVKVPGIQDIAGKIQEDQIVADPEVVATAGEEKISPEELKDRVKKGQAARRKGEALPENAAGIDRLIRKKLAEIGVRFGEAIRSAETEPGAVGDFIVARLGLTGPDAEKLRKAINDRVSELFRQYTEKEIAKLLASQSERPPRVVRTAIDKILEAGRLGGLTGTENARKIAELIGAKTLTESQLKELQDLANKIFAVPKDQANRRGELIEEFANKVASFTDSKWALPKAIWYANALSALTTHAINVFTTWQNVGIHWLTSLRRGPGAFAAATEAMARSIKEAGAQSAYALATGKVPEFRAIKRDIPGRLERLSGWEKIFIPLRWLSSRALKAEDLLMFVPMKHMEEVILTRQMLKAGGMSAKEASRAAMETVFGTDAMRSAAEAQAASEGYTGINAVRRVSEILEQHVNPEVRRRSILKAALSTFNEQTPYGLAGLVAQHASAVLSKIPGGFTLLPFPRTLANVFNESLNLTPVGLGRAASSFIKYQRHGETTLYGQPATPAEIADLTTRAAAGTLLLTGLAAWAAESLTADGEDDGKSFAIFGTGPKDKAKRDTWLQSGAKPNSVRIGGRYYSYLATPLALPMAIIGNVMDAVRYKDLDQQDWVNRLTYALFNVKDSMLQMSMLDGLARFLNTKDSISTSGSSQQAIDFLGRSLSTFVIPNAARFIDSVFDPTVYTKLDIESQIMSLIPFARRNSKVAVNGLGEPIKMTVLERYTRAASPDPLWRELARLEVGVLPAGLIWNGKMLTRQELYDVAVQQGQIGNTSMRRILEGVISSPGYASLPDANKKEILDATVERVRGLAKALVMSRREVVK